MAENDEIVPYIPSETEGLEHSVNPAEYDNKEGNVFRRLSTLSRTLSQMSAKEMKNFEIDENDFELKRVLRYMMNRSSEQGIEGDRRTDLTFENLTVVGKNNSASVVKTVGDVLGAPIVFLIDKLSNKPKVDFSKMEKTRNIIRNVSGICEAGSMTLVLGRPGAGCSTMLKALAGETQTYLSTEGFIEYRGISQKEMMKHFKHQVIYNPELDVHFPFLTVEQTMRFAIGCKTPSARIDNVSREHYVTTMKDLYLTLYGLKHVEKTLVGNDFVRGISGGQRKRVSIAEAMATSASVFCFDNATRGLDASTALEFVESLRTFTNLTRSTSVVTIYQASENIYKLFDDVTVLYYGRQIYFGPIDEAVAFFNKMGYKKAPRETSAEFLTSVTDPSARTPYEDKKGSVPTNAEEFEQYWLASSEYSQLIQNLKAKSVSFNAGETRDKFASAHLVQKQRLSRNTSPYTTNYFQQLKLCFIRNVQMLVNNKSYSVTLVGASIIQSLIIGSLYYNTKQTTLGSFSRGGIIFFSLLYYCLMGLAEVANLFENKPILNKQRGYTFFHPSAELVASTFVQTPLRFFATLIFSLILYFLSNLKREPGPFFAFLLFINITVVAVNSLFTLVASLCSTLSAANAFTGILMMSEAIYSSYMIQRPSMHWWGKWFSYCNPILYGFESMITMEFRGRKMPCDPTQLLPSGPSYQSVSSSNQVCAFVGASKSKQIYGSGNYVSGEIYLDLSYLYTFDHCWRNFGILIGFVIGLLAINALIVEFYNPIAATSDQLLFVKGAHLPDSILEATGANANLEDPESVSSSSKNEEKEQHRSDDSEATVGKLGSSDIYMWRNVNYIIPYDGQDRKLLEEVQGYVLPGTLTALMGESGAGKTTLLNVLARRTDFGVITGDMLINGKPVDSSFERRTGYVQQQDLHIAELTVRESLIFAARLRRPASVPDVEKIAYVDQILEILNMVEYEDSIAGVPGYGLNVEQRKKLSIATELVAKPSLLLCLDEPTSGLDSQSSWAIVQVLRSLAAAGQAVLCTIHQPSATLFEQFDRLLLLQNGGQTVYFGDIGENSRILLDYFESQGARKCSDYENPAEYILEAIGAGATAVVNGDWYKKWTQSDMCAKATKEIDELIAETQNRPPNADPELKKRFATSYWNQFRNVLHRTFTQFYRDLDYIMSKLMLMLLAGLLVGFSFWNVKHTVIGMQNLLFANFLAIIASAPLTNQIQGRAIQSRELFEVRESKSNTFHWSTLLISQYLVEIPYSVLFGTIYYICWYFLIQLDNEASRAGVWWLTHSIFFQLFYVSFALAIVYASPDLPTANLINGLLFSIELSFCGVVQSPKLMPGFWHFMWRVSPLTYFVESFVSLLLHNREVHCNSTELNYLNPPDGETCGSFLSEFFSKNPGYVQNPEATSNCGVCQYKVGDQYLKTVGMSYSHRWRNVGFFCVYICANIFFMVAAYYLLRVRKYSFSFASLFKRKKA